MRSVLSSCLLAGVASLLVGCQSAKFVYNAAPKNLNPAGPSILVMPIADARTNKAMDKVLEKGYWTDVQRAISAELESMGRFKSVVTATNSSDFSPLDFKLSPTAQRLEWEIPNYGRLQANAFMVGLFTGIVGGSIYLSTGINVNGHAIFLMQMESLQSPAPALHQEYSASVTNRFKKASCDVPATKSKMMSNALKNMLTQFKADVDKTLGASGPSGSVTGREDVEPNQPAGAVP